MKNKKTLSKAASDLKELVDDPSSYKVKITMNLDADVLEAVKDQAKTDGLKYQTWLNSFLRNSLVEENSLEVRIQRLEAKLIADNYELTKQKKQA